ncbi:MAG: activator of ATPase [Belnapia sp.]|nr:activator of ATPase [Belnapia sp.]
MPAAALPIFTMTRLFQAPRPLVWRAWTDPVLLARWFGPKGVASSVLRHELRPGGMLHIAMRSPDGQVMWGRFIYRTVEAPSRLVWLHGFGDAAGNLARAPFSPGWPLQMLTTVRFEEAGDATRMTLTLVPHEATAEECAVFAANLQSMHQGWSGSFEQLDAVLAAGPIASHIAG